MGLDSKSNNVWLRLHNSGKKTSPRNARAAAVPGVCQGFAAWQHKEHRGPALLSAQQAAVGLGPPCTSRVGVVPPQGHFALLTCVRFCHPILSLPSSLCTATGIPLLLPALCCLQNCLGCTLSLCPGHQNMEQGWTQGCPRGDTSGSRACSWPSAHITAQRSFPVRMLQSEPGRIQTNLCCSAFIHSLLLPRALRLCLATAHPNSHGPLQTAGPH